MLQRVTETRLFDRQGGSTVGANPVTSSVPSFWLGGSACQWDSWSALPRLSSRWLGESDKPPSFQFPVGFANLAHPFSKLAANSRKSKRFEVFFWRLRTMPTGQAGGLSSCIPKAHVLWFATFQPRGLGGLFRPKRAQETVSVRASVLSIGQKACFICWL